MNDLNTAIEFTNLKFNLSHDELMAFLKTTIENGFSFVCIPPSCIYETKKLLRDSGIKIVTVIDFPTGYGYLPQKFEEAKLAIDYEVDELDVVINHMNISSGKWSEVEEEVEGWGRFGKAHAAKIKLIVETDVVPIDDVLKISDFAIKSGIDFIKTATGVQGKTSVETVEKIKNHVGDKIKIKAAGGIKTTSDAIQMMQAGANRIGTSSLLQV